MNGDERKCAREASRTYEYFVRGRSSLATELCNIDRVCLEHFRFDDVGGLYIFRLISIVLGIFIGNYRIMKNAIATRVPFRKSVKYSISKPCHMIH